MQGSHLWHKYRLVDTLLYKNRTEILTPKIWKKKKDQYFTLILIILREILKQTLLYYPPPSIGRGNMMDVEHPSMYVMHLAAAQKAFSLHLTTKSIKKSILCLTSLPISRCTQKIPHPPGPQQIREEDTPGEWQCGDKGWHTHPGIMRQKYQQHIWRQAQQFWHGYIQVWTNDRSHERVGIYQKG